VSQSPNPASTCQNWKDRGLSDDEKVRVVRKHNELRRKVASGQETRGLNGPQPPAAFMPDLVRIIAVPLWFAIWFATNITARRQIEWNRSIPYLIQFCTITLRFHKVAIVIRRVRYPRIRRNRDNQLNVFPSDLGWGASDYRSEMGRPMPTRTRRVQKRG